MFSLSNRFIKKNFYFFTLFSAHLIIPFPSMAGGLSLNDQSASASGVSNAGMVASPSDASTVYFNPAGMSRFSGTNISFGNILLEIDARGRDSQTKATRADGQPVSGSGGGDHVKPALVPNAYITHEVNNWLDIGVGMFVPYGLGFDYDNNFAGRFIGDEVELVSVGLSPSIAINDGNGFSMAGGVNILYADAEQKSAVDFSGVELQFGLPPGSLEDGEARINGDDVALEFTFGILWQASSQTALGFSARSGTEFNLKGDGTIDGFPRASGGSLAQVTVSEPIVVPIKIPMSLSFGISHGLSEKLELRAGATWAKWSEASALTVLSRADIPVAFPAAAPPSDQVRYWKDTWQWRIGAIWQYSPTMALKSGYAFDEAPATTETRSPVTPFDDSHQISVGAQFKDIMGEWVVDLFVSRVIYEGDISIDYSPTDPAQGQTSFESEYDVVPWSAGFQLSRRF